MTRTPALQADLNGDGAKEILLVTRKLELHMLAPPSASSLAQGFAPATVKWKQQLQPSAVYLGQHHPVALAAGYIDEPDAGLAHARRKMVVVVVTSGWLIVCLDHNLKVMWEKSIHGHFPHHAAVREVCICSHAYLARIVTHTQSRVLPSVNELDIA